jgi:DNA-binding IscR family transcriptional regulator
MRQVRDAMAAVLDSTTVADLLRRTKGSQLLE